jgi:hypothetical protein
MNLTNRIVAFSKLGEFLSQFSREEVIKKEGVENNDLFFDGFKHQLKLAQQHNGWFTKDNILFAVEGWAKLLTQTSLESWLSPYSIAEKESKKVAVIMAGNIPLVGFHDFLSVLILGNEIIVKQAYNDKQLLPFLAKYLELCEASFKGKIQFTQTKLTGFDAVIATGSDNTARYFDYYFNKYPSIIRKNRNSVAILTGNETEEQLTALGEDVFRYFGLGCRSVSKLLVPENYNFDAFFGAIYNKSSIIDGAKYANNYDYNKAVYIMSQFELLENGFLMLKEDENYGSPIATLFYEYYKNQEELSQKLKKDADKIQCHVADGFSETEIAFGQTQHPNLDDYADGIDTIEFLSKI